MRDEKMRITKLIERIWIMIFLLFTVFCFSTSAECMETGTKAPRFSIKSGDGKEFSPDTGKSRITITLYETKDTIEQNRSFKNDLGALLKESATLKDGTVVLPVIDCTSASWLTRKVWEMNLVKNSKKENVTIYGDWNGRMKADYGVKVGMSNVIITDRKGYIRFTKAGQLNNRDIHQIKTLIRRLTVE